MEGKSRFLEKILLRRTGDFFQNRMQAKWNEAETFTDDCGKHIALLYAGRIIYSLPTRKIIYNTIIIELNFQLNILKIEILNHFQVLDLYLSLLKQVFCFDYPYTNQLLWVILYQQVVQLMLR